MLLPNSLNPRHGRCRLPLVAFSALGLVCWLGCGGEQSDPMAPGPQAGTGGGGDASEDAQTGPLVPIVVEAEAGMLGEGVRSVVDEADDSITYVTAVESNTEEPADAADPRIVHLEVSFPRPGSYQIFTRFRIGPDEGNDDSYYLNLPSNGQPDWVLVNGLSGITAPGQEGYVAGQIVRPGGGDSTVGVWKWTQLQDLRFIVPEGELTQTVQFSTREDGLDIDRFAFSLAGETFIVGYTPEQLEAEEAGVEVEVEPLPDPYEPPPEQVPLAAGANKYLGMVCCGTQRPFLENYFNQVTPENAGKWGSVEGTRDEFNWQPLDDALAVAQENGFPFRFHVLLWGSQQPGWIAALPPEEQLAEIRQWFEAINERYGDALDFIEVANEFENQPPSADYEGNYTEALGGAGESGYDWVLNGFRMAREIFPASSQLMLNEYGVLSSDELTDTYVGLVEALQAEELIDAIGVQGHAFSTRGPVEEQVARLDRLASTGLPLYITEMDIDGPEVPQLLDYQRLFRAFWEHSGVQGITLWGYRDGMWRTDQEATLVYGNGAEKPALRWLKGYVQGTAPQVVGPTTVSLSEGAVGTPVGDFAATQADGSPHEPGTPVSFRLVDGTGRDSVAFDETGALLLQRELPAGSYQVRFYADVNATVSELHEVTFTID